MDGPAGTRRRKVGSGLRPWLILTKIVGVFACLGGLAAISAIGWFGPVPTDAAGWQLLRGAVRAVFWPCVFSGLMLTVVSGIALWLRHPLAFLRTRWFRLKAVLLVVTLPVLHLGSRGRVLAFYEAVDAGRLETLDVLWRDVTVAFSVALVVLLGVTALGRVKPRLGERYGARRRPRPGADGDAPTGDAGRR